jgi:serine/threonine protein phosphatase 1
VRWIIGDIHGMLAPLRALLQAIGERDPDPRYFFLGDYVNRGPDTRGVIDLLLELKGAHFLRGNHDDVLDMILSGKAFVETIDPVAAFGWFLRFGLLRTLASYGVKPRQIERFARKPERKTIEALTAAIPQTHRRFIRDLEPYAEEPDFFVAHASWPVTEPVDGSMPLHLAASPELRHRLIWGRFTLEEIAGPKRWSRLGFFGHTPVPNYAELAGDTENVPVVGPQITLLDTGAALGPQGRLTAWCAERQTFIQADPQGNLLPTRRKSTS